MNHRVLIAASIAALALAGCKKEAAPEPGSTAAPVGIDAVAPATPEAAMSPDQTFADTAATSDMFEIETSRLAATKAQSAKVKQFAAEMIKAHTDSTAKLKTAASAASPAITPAPQLTAAQQQTLDDLNTKSGADFDKAYAAAQVDAHQMTLDKLKDYAASGAVPSLKSFASGLVPAVTAHLNMAKSL